MCTPLGCGRGVRQQYCTTIVSILGTLDQPVEEQTNRLSILRSHQSPEKSVLFLGKMQPPTLPSIGKPMQARCEILGDMKKPDTNHTDHDCAVTGLGKSGCQEPPVPFHLCSGATKKSNSVSGRNSNSSRRAAPGFSGVDAGNRLNPPAAEQRHHAVSPDLAGHNPIGFRRSP